MNDFAAQQTAERSRERLFAGDRAAQALGIAIVAVGPGTATATMTVGEAMVNGHATCHGGLIATLADTAFAYACNSNGEATVASGFSIDFVAPARAGDVLTAAAAQVAGAGRTGIFDVVVQNQRGERVAVFRGRSHTLKRPSTEPGAAPCP